MISLYLAVLETDEDKYEFEEMYIKCRQQMYNLAYCILHNVQDAEDAVHQSFLTIANNYEKIKQKNVRIHLATLLLYVGTFLSICIIKTREQLNILLK